MSGALPYVDTEECVVAALEAFESWLENYLEQDQVSWKIVFDQYSTIFIDDPSSDLIDISITGRLSEQIPEEYANDSGEIRTPVFPAGAQGFPDNIKVNESVGHEELFSEIVVELQELEEGSASEDIVLEDVIERHNDHGIVDAFGSVWGERDSLLAVKAAERSLSEEDPDIVVSFDVLQRMAPPFQYADYLKYEQHEDGELLSQHKVSFNKIVESESLSSEELPEAEKVYVHQDKRVAASDHDISSQDIAQAIQGNVLRKNSFCTLSDPTDRGLRARVGSIEKVVLEEDEETYRGFVRISPSVDVSLVYDFYAALRVPEAPYLTHDLAQETVDWDRDHNRFSGWSAAGDGFAYHSIDRRRDIQRRLLAHKYWVIHGEKYRRKADFEDDVEALIEMMESELNCEVSWRKFEGTRIQKTPIRQSDVLEQIRNDVRTPPDRSTLLEAIDPFTNSSEDVEDIDEPLFPSDLSEFVADTSIIDAQVITRLVSEGDLYRSTVLIPDVVLEEIHRQVEKGASRGDSGLEELTALRELTEKDIINLETVTTEKSVDTEDNVAVDQSLIQVAKKHDVPLCSADETLLKFAEAAGVTAYPLEQELSHWSQTIKNSLRQSGELPITDLVRKVYQKVDEKKFSEESVHQALFRSPGRIPSQDIAMEMAIREEINRLVRRGELYQQGGQVGLKQEVTVVPSLGAIKDRTLFEKIDNGELSDRIEIPPHKIQFKVLLPDTFKHWASLQGKQEYLLALDKLEDLDSQAEIRIEWREVLPSETGLALLDEEQFSNLFQGLQRKTAVELNTVIGTGSSSILINH
ncbi:ATPase (PilT family) [Halalkaliarchaeum sp. AArc-CO]|uniref:hypothetical protein n=1 Tax=Halalkaliarchaeum sp. AArc-CO TaxID=2866381 RepID=UPI00217E4AA2|nr:hypothetical protein [Halalkaliarchaeum sp. AArc-CO]UWG50146.1 ATPase (PilT family) [Halalkaliarchaeum sp. AArc-CO]